ncbi:MAG: sensor histidine kinase [Cryomorphaceae bacterium]
MPFSNNTAYVYAQIASLRRGAFLLVLLLVPAFSCGAEEVSRDSITALFQRALKTQSRDLDSAMALAKEGLKASRYAGFETGVGWAFMRFGSIYRERAINDSALFYYRKTLKIRLKNGELLPAAYACKDINYVFQDLGKRDSAFFYLLNAMRLCDRADDALAKAMMHVELAELSIKYEAYDDALRYLESATPAVEASGDSVLNYQLYGEYGILFLAQGRFEEALQYLVKASEYVEGLGSKYYKARHLNRLASCYEGLGNARLAEQLYRQAVLDYKALEMPLALALGQFNLGQALLRSGQVDSALVYLHRSLRGARGVQDRYRVARCLDVLSEAYAENGAFEKAYAYQRRFARAQDSVLNEEKVTSIAEMQTRYDTEKKEQEILLLDERSRTRTAQRNALLAGAAVLLLALFLLGFAYVQRRRLAKKNEQLAKQRIDALLNTQEINTYNAMLEGQEEERKRIASDLHDRLGSMLSTIKLLFGALDDKIDRSQVQNEERFQKVTTLLDDAVVEVRRISHNLGTGMVTSFGLVAALQDLTDSINESNLIQCKLLTYGMDERLDTQTEVAVYRMVQEIMTNTLKHADAQVVQVQVNRSETTLSVTVEDDGKGFDPAKAKRQGGMGLENLSARAAKLNGSYHIDSAPGRGSISIIEIPIHEKGEN